MADFRDDFTGETVEVDLSLHVPSGPGSGWRREGANADSVGVNPAPVNELRTRQKGDEIYWPQVGGADFAPGPDAQLIADWSTNDGGAENLYLALRVTDINNWIGIGFFGTGNIGVRLAKCMAGVTTNILQTDGATRATAGNLIRVDAVGDRIEVFYSDDNGVTWTSQGFVTETFNNTASKCAVVSINGSGINNTLIRWLEFNKLGGGGGVSGVAASRLAAPVSTAVGALRTSGALSMAFAAMTGRAQGLLRLAGGGAVASPPIRMAGTATLRLFAAGSARMTAARATVVRGALRLVGTVSARMARLAAFGGVIEPPVTTRRHLRVPPRDRRFVSATSLRKLRASALRRLLKP